MKKAITATDIAKMAGCCRQAVSSVITGRGNSRVSPEKRELILEIAKNYNYRLPPSVLNQLQDHGRKLIGIVMAAPCSGFFELFATTLSTQLQIKGMDSVILSPPLRDSITGSVESFARRGGSGVIYLNCPNEFNRSKLPLPSVVIGGSQYDTECDWEYAFRAMTLHHIQKHHRKYPVFVQEYENSFSNALALKGVKNGAAEVGLDFSYEKNVLTLLWNENFDRQIISAIADGADIFICRTDEVAARLMIFLQSKGIKVPEDAAVSGCGGKSITRCFSTPLSSIIYPVHRLSETAVEKLCAKLQLPDSTPSNDDPLLIQPGMHFSGSCGCPVEPMNFIWWEGIPESYDFGSYYQMKPLPDSFDIPQHSLEIR